MAHHPRLTTTWVATSFLLSALLFLNYYSQEDRCAALTFATPAAPVATFRNVSCVGNGLSETEEVDTSRDPAPRRYLVLLQATEGIAGWIQSVREVSALAAATGRYFVEPCVRDGHLVACRPGAVRVVPDGRSPADLALAAAGVDVIGIPASRARCNLPDVPDDFQPLPLSAYFDWESMTTNWSLAPMVRYHEWEAEAFGTGKGHGRLLLNTSSGRYISRAPLVTGKADAAGCKNGVQAGGQSAMTYSYFSFPWVDCGVTPGWLRNENITSLLLTEPLASVSDVFVGEWTRAPQQYQMSVYKYQWPRFNELHYIAARRWVNTSLRHMSRDTRYAVFQWRAVLSGAKNMEMCLAEILNATSRLPQLLRRGGRRSTSSSVAVPLRSVLVSDLPSPESECRIWDHAAGDPARDSAVAAFNALGLIKYDASPAAMRLDGGMLAIRDVILGIEADWYFTCARVQEGSFERLSELCMKCFWGSSFILQTLVQRRARNVPSVKDWFAVNPANITPPLPQGY